jgi:homoserine kinase
VTDPGAVTVFAPGSTSNLGPGFDCLGLAFSGKGDRVTARRASRPGVHIESCSDARVPLDSARNTAGIAAAAVLRDHPDLGVELALVKGLPLSGGMGGSAASAVAGAMAVDALFHLRRSRQQLLEAALEAEAAVAGRHADNVAPSLLGGAVIVLRVDPVEVVPVRVHPSLTLVLVTPAYEVRTQEARRVLPDVVPRGGAVAQAAHLGALVLALERGDLALLRRAAEDHIAEPARAPLYPGYPEARAAGLIAGAATVTMSGAGPTVVALAPRASRGAVGEALRAAFARAGFESSVHEADVDHQGARVVG